MVEGVGGPTADHSLVMDTTTREVEDQAQGRDMGQRGRLPRAVLVLVTHTLLDQVVDGSPVMVLLLPPTLPWAILHGTTTTTTTAVLVMVQLLYQLPAL